MGAKDDDFSLERVELGMSTGHLNGDVWSFLEKSVWWYNLNDIRL